MFRRRRFAPVAIAAVVLALAVQAVTAQTYPPPTGNCVSTLSVPAPALSEAVVVTVQAADEHGQPLVGAHITGTILSQLGSSDATLSPTSFVADAAGIGLTSLHTGSQPGTIVIGFVCAKAPGPNPPTTTITLSPPPDLTTQVTVPVGTPPGLPNTGTGPAAGGRAGTSSPLLPTLLRAGLALAGTLMLTVKARRSRRR